MADVTGNPTVSATTRAGIVLGLVMLMAVGGTLLSGGRPRSSWFYPYMILLPLLGIAHAYQMGTQSAVPAGSSPPRSVSIALLSGALGFGISAAVIYFYFTLLGHELSWFPWFFICGTTAINIYRQKRGYAFAVWPSIVMFVVVIALLWLTRRPGSLI